MVLSVNAQTSCDGLDMSSLDHEDCTVRIATIGAAKLYRK